MSSQILQEFWVTILEQWMENRQQYNFPCVALIWWHIRENFTNLLLFSNQLDWLLRGWSFFRLFA